VISAFSFIRALQRAYEQVWGLKPLSFKNAPRQLIWLIAFLMVLWIGYQVRRLSLDIAVVTPGLAVLLLLMQVAFWWVTAYLLLGGRVGWRQLLPGAVLSCVAVSVYGLVSSIYLPGRISESAHQYGPIGLIFIILSWYFVLFCIVVAGAAIGPVLLEEDNALARFMRGPRSGMSVLGSK
jgi:membrane protein